MAKRSRGFSRSISRGGVGARPYTPPVFVPAGPVWLNAYKLADGTLPSAVADFVEGHYWAGGAERSLSDVVDITAYRSELGYLVNAGAVTPQYTGALKDALISADWTVVTDVEVPDIGNQGASVRAVFLRDEDDSTELCWGPQVTNTSIMTGVHVYDYYGDLRSNVAFPYIALPTTIRIAFTRLPSGAQALSFNGRDVVTRANGTTDDAFTIASVRSWNPGATASGSINIKTVIVYPPRPDADLPVLSALT